MKFNIAKEWIMENAHKEDGQNVEAGTPPIIPATGGLEAELREKPEELHAFAESLSETILIRLARIDARASLSFIGQHLAIAGDILAFLTPLLDRREGKLATKDAEIERLGKLLGATIVEPTTAFSEEDYTRTITNLRAQLTSAQSALRESEAARGEDSKRLDWLEAHAQTFGQIYLCRYPFAAPNRDKLWMAKIEYWEQYANTSREAIDLLRAAIDAARAAASTSGEGKT